MNIRKTAWVGMALALVVGCHSNKTPQTTAQDVAAAQQEVQREVDRARTEAAKDLKSAAKVSGGSSRGVAQAKAEGAYDIAMVKADGDHTVATEKCMTLQASMQQACKDQADAEYETAKATAKATRVARQP